MKLPRSTKGIKRLSKKERANILLPEKVKETLIGIMLGDGHIAKRSSTSNCRLVFAQTAVAHKEYFNHVFEIFKSFCVNGFVPLSRVNLDKRTNTKHSSISFTTMQLPCFN
jgi:hypothetical protein